jgi:hypothetical protein
MLNRTADVYHWKLNDWHFHCMHIIQKQYHLKIAFAVLNFSNSINNDNQLQLIFIRNNSIKIMSKKNSKQANPSGAPCGRICCVIGHLQ